MNKLYLIIMFGVTMIASTFLFADEKIRSPAEGYNIHFVAPYRHEDGSVYGPYHHYCKQIKAEIMQCMIFMSDDPNAELVEIEYFIDKKLARTSVTLEQWNRHFHDYAKEIASGRVHVLDASPEKAKEIADAVSKTDGVIFQLWPMDTPIPNGEVTFPTTLSHSTLAKLDIQK